MVIIPEQAKGKNYNVVENQSISYPEVSSCLTLTLIIRRKPVVFGGIHFGLLSGQRTISMNEALGYCNDMGAMLMVVAKLKKVQADVAFIIGHADSWDKSESAEIRRVYQAIHGWAATKAGRVQRIDVEGAIKDRRYKFMADEDIIPSMEEEPRKADKEKLSSAGWSVDIEFDTSGGFRIVDRARKEYQGAAHGAQGHWKA